LRSLREIICAICYTHETIQWNMFYWEREVLRIKKTCPTGRQAGC